jgi:biotin carboxyl carrier protein
LKGSILTNSNPVQVKAKISGVFYRAPNPEADPFVEVGSVVKKGQAIALLESMKLFSKVKSPVAGRIAEIKGTNGEAVNTGQTLFLIQPIT